jgi:queuine tRNA-ribosyltransferase
MLLDYFYFISWLPPVISGAAAPVSLINVRNVSLRCSPLPLESTCGCHACRNYTRAYIFHLFKAHEMLGEILLYAHNQWQLCELFKIARSKIASEQLQPWVNALLLSE